MSLQPKKMVPVPEETVRIARAAFPKGNAWLSLRNELGTIYSDEMFVGLYPSRGQPAGTPCRLSLVLVMQLPLACRTARRRRLSVAGSTGSICWDSN